MNRYNYFLSAIVSLSLISLCTCNQIDGQREFEREAFRSAENFTETNESGQIVNENSDPDDWRVGPFFQGVIYVDPAFPNPVLSSNRLTLNLLVTGVDAVSGYRIFAYYGSNSIRYLEEDFRSPLPPGGITVTIDALSIARFAENPQGLYRIIIEDLDGNIISYGDIRVE